MIRVSRLTRCFSGRAVIQDLSLDLAQGERVCLKAPSGAGKSTLIRILAGLDKTFSGQVQVKGRLTAVFQTPGLFPHKTLAQNICYGLDPANPGHGDDYLGWLAATGLESAENLYPCEASGGMRQKATIVRAFLPRPDLVLMDEPFKSLDKAGKARIAAHIRTAFPGVTIFMTTHDGDEPALMDSRVVRFSGPGLSGGGL